MTADELKQAVAENGCAQIAAELAKTPLTTEAMKFQGAICFCRNGEAERALALFDEIRQMGSPRADISNFWAAKCHAILRRDSLSVAILQAMPRAAINEKMLSQPEFDRLAIENPAFSAFKKSLAPHFNVWTALLSAITLLGFMMGGTLLFGRSRFSAGEKKLAIVILAFSIVMTGYVLIWTGHVARFPYLQNTWQFLTLLVGPSLFFYLKDTFKEAYSGREMDAHYFVPAIGLLCTLPIFMANFGFRTPSESDIFQLGTSETLLAGHLTFYTVLIHFLTKNEWQVDDNIRDWGRIVSGGMAVYAAAFVSYFILAKCSFFSPNWDYSISLVMSLGILAIAYMGFLQKRVFRSEPIGNFLPAKKYLTSSLTPAASESIKRKMELLLDDQQVFKENELRLADLAAYLDITYHQLSQVINEHYGINFFDLINRYRVAHVKRLLASPAHNHLTIMQVAYEAGFNNKASFNRYFKKEIGMTPSAFRIRENRELA